MRFVVIIAIVYVTAMVALAAIAQSLARSGALASPVAEYINGPFVLRVDRDRPLPFGLDGHGRAPGEVKVSNTRGIVLDSERIDDVYTVRNVRWEAFKVHFDFDQDGKTYESSLALEP